MTSISTAPPQRLHIKQIWHSLPTIIKEDFTGSISANLVWAFRVYIAFHMFTRSLDLYLTSAPDWLILAIQGATLTAAFITLHRRYYYLGLIVLLGFQLMMVVVGFPDTGNHYFVELYLLIILLLWPNRQNPTTGDIQNGSAYYLIQLLLLSIYFYAGLHKAIHGFWLDGEYVATMLYNVKGDGLPATLQMLVPIGANLFNLPVVDLQSQFVAEMGRVPIVFPNWFFIFAVVLGWITVISEIIVPPLVLIRSTRNLGLWLMFVMTTAIAMMSWEIEFLLVAWGCMLLFFPNKPIRNYAILLFAHLSWSFFVYFAGIPVWEF